MLGSALVAHTQPAGKANVGEAVFDSSGTYSWTVPEGVDSISVVCVGGGAGSTRTGAGYSTGGGGALAYRNDLAVTPGSSLTVVVGAGGVGGVGIGTNGGNSSVNTSPTVYAGGGKIGDGDVNPGNPDPDGGTVISGFGGAGGYGQEYDVERALGGGGAGGYSGVGGRGLKEVFPALDGSGGAGAGGNGGGGGVGLFGEGASGVAPGGGGSGGESATNVNGGDYGGGAGLDGNFSVYGDGAGGAVRIVWPGDKRQFPSTLVDKR